jgi:hypothetical protein
MEFPHSYRMRSGNEAVFNLMLSKLAEDDITQCALSCSFTVSLSRDTLLAVLSDCV